MAVAFFVPGDPRGWARARLSRSGGKVRHFMDAKTAAYEASWAALAHRAMAGRALIAEPVSVEIEARFAPPASASKAKRAAMLSGALAPTKKPDLDNIIKNLDALTGVVFRDDVQVVTIRASKFYAEAPGVTVAITPIEGVA